MAIIAIIWIYVNITLRLKMSKKLEDICRKYFPIKIRIVETWISHRSDCYSMRLWKYYRDLTRIKKVVKLIDGMEADLAMVEKLTCEKLKKKDDSEVHEMRDDGDTEEFVSKVFGKAPRTRSILITGTCSIWSLLTIFSNGCLVLLASLWMTSAKTWPLYTSNSNCS